jgi:predicted metal-dependent HD superfamily phosphohydrolase
MPTTFYLDGESVTDEGHMTTGATSRESTTDLVDRFVAALTPVAQSPARLTAGHTAVDLLRRWSQPQRQYHNEHHLRAVLDIVDRFADHAGAPDQVRLAAWYHDAVYDPQRTDNEQQSAALARHQLRHLGVPADSIREVVRLIEMTADHVTEPGDRDGALLCAADLAILAAPPAAYEAYRAQIRAEYAFLPADGFARGRAGVLSGLLARDQLYQLPPAAAWEPLARANLQAELRDLAAAQP